MSSTLDARGLICPLPVLKAKKALRPLDSGDELTILATDAGAPDDFVAFCENTGDTLVASTEANGVYAIVIRKT